MERTNLKGRWTTADTGRSNLLRRCEKYAAWTIPHIFPENYTKDTEQQNSVNGIGAESTNFLSNKLNTTLFSPHSPYFRMLIAEELLNEALEAGFQRDDIEMKLAGAEKRVVSDQETKKGLRSSGTLIAKLLIITGNALVYYNEKDKPIQAYNLRDYVVFRDGAGVVYKMITRDKKDYSTLPKETKESLPEEYQKMQLEKVLAGHEAEVELFTEIRKIMDENGNMSDRWETQQAVDEHDLGVSGNYPSDKLPWIPLVWHLNRGEDYGRGLVEDYSGDFHALTTLSRSLVEGIAILSDIKFLVNPGSAVDVKEFNASPPGSYHQGREGDISSPQLSRSTDFGIINEAIDKYERRISRGFLNGSANRRQAERVTAEEIRLDARDLETSQGGLYSRMVIDWQTPYAKLGLQDIDFEMDGDFDVQIVAGLDVLSRSGDMDNFRWMLDDLAATQNIPEDMRQAMSPMSILKFVARNRGVDHTQFSKTKEQYEQDKAAIAREAQNKMLLEEQAKTAGAVAVAQSKSK